MTCIFCKKDSSNFKSIEHIIPQSLGNTTLILPKGVVCDKCNNYFSRKVEQPFFDLQDIKNLRFHEGIPNKRGRVPSIDIIMNGEKVNVRRFSTGTAFPENNEIIRLSKHIPSGDFIPPKFNFSGKLANSMVVSRFIAKIAFESFALKLINEDGWLEYLIDDHSFDAIRDYVRLGSKQIWPYSIREIYHPDSYIVCPDGLFGQIVHESDFLMIPGKEFSKTDTPDTNGWYVIFIVAIWGLEFAMNIAGPDVEGLEPYQIWLKKHNNISPLYYGKNI